MTITAFLEAAKKAREATFESYPQAQFDLRVAASNAAKEIEELVNLCRKITDRGRTVSAEDVDRIREIVGGGV